MQTGRFETGLVSAVTPVYNGERYLAAFLDSILAQTYGRLEVILADDGSGDGTVALAESYRERMEQRGIRFVILRGVHRNASHALRAGLALVTGEYLIWPDADDVLEKDSVRARAAFLNQHPDVQCVRSLAYYFNPETGERAAADEKRGDLKQERLFWDVLESRTFVCCGCYMLRSEAFFAIYPEGKIPVSFVGQNFQMLLPFLYRHACPTIGRELYGVAVRAGSHSRRPLDRAQTEEKYREYERLIDEIADLCGMTDRAERRRIKRWKLRRRLELAFLYRQYGRGLSTCACLAALGEKGTARLALALGRMRLAETGPGRLWRRLRRARQAR